MKRFLVGILAMGLPLVAVESAPAQGNSRGTSKITISGKAVSVEYGRPSLNGRKVSELLDQVEPGTPWRLGADKSTTFSTGVDLQFGDVTIPAVNTACG